MANDKKVVISLPSLDSPAFIPIPSAHVYRAHTLSQIGGLGLKIREGNHRVPALEQTCKSVGDRHGHREQNTRQDQGNRTLAGGRGGHLD